MKILIADDSRTVLGVLHTAMEKWGYEVVEAPDGREALRILLGKDAPRLAVLDWVMPGLTGPDVCRRIREFETELPPYLILLTVMGESRDVVAGFAAGADDYLAKPFDSDELRARVHVGFRVLKMQERLHHQVTELQEALDHVQRLEGMLPICSYCKKVRDDHDYWQQVETYMSKRAGVQFTHGICPDCIGKALKPQR